MTAGGIGPPDRKTTQAAASRLAGTDIRQRETVQVRLTPTDRRPAFTTLPLCLVLVACACGAPPAGDHKDIQAVYDKQSGRLTELKYDSDRDGKVDTVSFMDGTRVLRIEIDKDEDGKIDRWEYYDAAQKLQKVGFSRLNDGIEDAWSFADADGTVVRIEISTKRDARVSRVEHYQGDQQVSAEEDTDGDGQFDKWETYGAGRLASVAFDSLRRGKPDRRLTYATDGGVKIEVDPNGTGSWTSPR